LKFHHIAVNEAPRTKFGPLDYHSEYFVPSSAVPVLLL
jgi:hypothetical protein